MTIAERIMSWISPGHRKAKALDVRLNAALAETRETQAVVRQIVETSKAEAAEAVELSGKTRERLARLEARRAQRKKMDPHVQVVIDTVRMMEGRT